MEESLRELFPLFEGVVVKVLLVNDGSSLEIQEDVNSLLAAFEHLDYFKYDQNQGKGFAIRMGLKQVHSQFYIYTDWDFPFGVESVYEAYRSLQYDNADLLIGVRSHNYFSSLPLLRKIISQGLRILNFFVLHFRYIDTQAGIKGLSNNARAVFLGNKTNSFIFELEFIRDCFRRKLSISYLSVSHKNDITFSNFGVKTITKELRVLMKIILT